MISILKSDKEKALINLIKKNWKSGIINLNQLTIP